MNIARIAVLSVALGTAACGGQTPAGPSAVSNSSPTVTASTSRTFGIAQITTFTFNASSTDTDGDPVTVTWNFGDGTSGSGASVTKRYSNGGTMRVVATANDNRGGSGVSAPLSVTVGSMSGTWRGSIDLDDACLRGVTKAMSAVLTQQSGSIRGTISLPEGLCSFQPGSAQTDPAEPGTISGDGSVRIRIKIPPYIDTYLEGRMDSSGRRITGGLQGSGHRGTPFVLNKQ